MYVTTQCRSLSTEVTVDRNRDGHLEWNNSEIREFVRRVFEAQGLPAPAIPEIVWCARAT